MAILSAVKRQTFYYYYQCKFINASIFYFFIEEKYEFKRFFLKKSVAKFFRSIFYCAIKIEKRVIKKKIFFLTGKY